jgi:hypothetical protein
MSGFARCGLLAGLVLVAGCATEQPPGRVLDVVSSCGTVLYTGYPGNVVTPLSAPTARDRAAAPAPGTALPPPSPTPSAPVVIMKVTSDCAHADQVTLSPLTGALVRAVARRTDGGISGLNLDVVGPVTVYDFRRGRLVGAAHLATGR